MLQKLMLKFGFSETAGDDDKFPQVLQTSKFLDKQRLIIR